MTEAARLIQVWVDEEESPPPDFRRTDVRVRISEDGYSVAYQGYVYPSQIRDTPSGERAHIQGQDYLIFQI